MNYLSRKNTYLAKSLSRDLLKINGWQDQFAITKKILNKYSAIVDDFSVNGIGRDKHKPALIKSIVDLIVVSYHLINYLDIKPRDFTKIGFTGYKIQGNAKEPKIPRSYKKILKQEYNISGTKINEDLELDIAAYSILQKQTENMGNLTGAQFQLCIASEEAGELAKEISKYIRHSLTGAKDLLKTARANIIDELFDALFTIRYTMIIAGITKKDLNDFARIYIPQIWVSEASDKLKDKLQDKNKTCQTHDYSNICRAQINAMKSKRKIK